MAPRFRTPIKQEDRQPVETYEDAVNRLVILRATEHVGQAAYEIAVRLVADIYWVKDATVRRDVFIACRHLFGGDAW